MEQKNLDKLLSLLRDRFNMYHAECIMGMLLDDNIDVVTFMQEIIKIKNAEANDIDEYDNPEIISINQK